MAPEELQELRDWTARKCGLKVVNRAPRWLQKYDNGIMVDNWLPDRPGSGQIWMVINQIKKELFSVRRQFINNLERIIATKYPELKEGQTITGLYNLFFMEPVDILKAWKATEETMTMTPAEYLRRPYHWCLVWDTESKTWTGRILEFPGCIAQADSADILLSDLKQAALDWIAAALDLGQEIPDPVERVWPK